MERWIQVRNRQPLTRENGLMPKIELPVDPISQQVNSVW